MGEGQEDETKARYYAATPWWMGLIFDRTGSYYWALLPLTVIYCLSAFGYWTLPQAREDPTGHHHCRGAQAVGEVTNYRPLDSAFQPAQGIGQGVGSPADSQIVLDRNEEDGETGVDGAVF